MDMGHYHPTETLTDKISAVLTFKTEVLLHVSRGIRWDSDHVVIFNDELRALFTELVRGGALGRAKIALDFFDASLNRIGAWVIGTRATLKAILYALLEPTARLCDLEGQTRLAEKLALLEELKAMPWGAVWDRYCHDRGVPVGAGWLNEMNRYDAEVIRKR
jgi:L-rhamnose isomerase